VAVCFFQIKSRSKLTSRHPASKVAQYMTREGVYAPAQHQVDYLTRDTAEVLTRDDLIHKEVGNLPPWAGESAIIFFAASWEYERANGRYATTFEMALPRELSRQQQLQLTRDFVDIHCHDKPYLWVMHEPSASDGGVQPHIHLMFSDRKLDGIAREAPQFFARWNRAEPARGGCQKEMYSQHFPAAVRQRWADLTNYVLEQAGEENRIDPRSVWAQGSARQVEKRIRPHDKHKNTLQWQALLAQRKQASLARVQEQAQARLAWEQRKQYLGINDLKTISKAEFIQRITHDNASSIITPQKNPEVLRQNEHTHEEELQATARLRAEAQRLERSISTLEAQLRIHARLAGREDGPRRGRLAVKLYEEDGYGR
jgi:hypothetical protein